MLVCQLIDIPDHAAEQSRIADMEFSDVSLVVGLFLPFPAPEGKSEDYHADKDPQDAERIADCACRGHVVRRPDLVGMDLEKGLLGGSEHRSVGRRTAKKAHDVGKWQSGDKEGDDCGEGSQDNG